MQTDYVIHDTTLLTGRFRAGDVMTQHSTQQGFQAGGHPEDLFTGTAAYYAAFRRPYPASVVDYLVKRCGLEGDGRLLDAGCGTGQVFQVMARYFDEVIAIDPDPQMIAYARRTVADLGLGNVTLRQMRADDLQTDTRPLRMAIFGASFHWTDRPRVGDVIHDLLEPNGTLVVLSPSGIHSGTSDWEAAIREALDRHLGPDRRAGSGLYRGGERHEQALARTRFTKVEVTDISVAERWSIDDIVGYLYSTSYASKNILGDRAEAFESDIRRRLHRLATQGEFERLVEYQVILAEK
jgi:SAM-dependent methyltransferase